MGNAKTDKKLEEKNLEKVSGGIVFIEPFYGRCSYCKKNAEIVAKGDIFMYCIDCVCKFQGAAAAPVKDS